MIASGKTRLAGVLGWPVGHSLSPRLHGYWLEHHRIDGAYVPLPVRPEDLAQVVPALARLGFAGFNVTLPHKQAVAELIESVDEEARRIGAVNTVVVDADGCLAGSNTDAFGFIENLRAGAPGWRAEAGPAVVLGAGGAARAVLVALIEAGAGEIRLANRSLGRAQALAAAAGAAVRVVPWTERAAALEGAMLLVNATSLGMTGQPPLELALDALPAAAVVNDIVYAPLETPLLANARRRGHPAVDGLGMLLHQGRPGFAAWFGVMPEVSDELRAFVLAA